MEAVRSASTTASAAAADTLPFSKEVRNFIKAAETLLSPALRTSELTADDCEVIKEYLITLSNAKHPWSSRLPIKYT